MTNLQMKESCEFRIDEKFASLIFGSNEGVRLGDSLVGYTTRKVEISTSDPRFLRIGEVDEQLRRKHKTGLFTSWHISRSYSQAELAKAALFHLTKTAMFEPCGSQCGTKYDFSMSCRECHAPPFQQSELVLDLRKAPKTRDIAVTIARDEWIVSQRLAGLMADAGLTGFELRPVRHKSRYSDDAMDFHAVPSGRELLRRAEAAGCPHPSAEFWYWLNRSEQRKLSEAMAQEWIAMRSERERHVGKPVFDWYQIVVTSRRVSTVQPTKFGIDPFNDDAGGEYRCTRLKRDKLGEHIAGCNILSEVHIDISTYDGSDIVCTRQRIGWPNLVAKRSGLGESGGGGTPLMLISPRFRRVLMENNIRGWKVEVAYAS